MATISYEKTRIGKGQAKVTIDETDFGVLTGDVEFVPENEENIFTKGNMPVEVELGGSWISKKKAHLTFRLASIDDELIARAYGMKFASNVISDPITTDYIQKPLLTTVFYGARFVADGTPVVDQESGETGDGSTKAFSFTMTFTGKRITPGSVSIHDEDDVETFTDSGDGLLTSDGTPAGTGTVDYYSGAVSVTFTTAPAATKKVEFDLTPKTEYEDKITIYAGEFRGAAPARKYGAEQMELEFTVDAKWDEDKCTAANGLWKVERNAV